MSTYQYTFRKMLVEIQADKKVVISTVYGSIRSLMLSIDEAKVFSIIFLYDHSKKLDLFKIKLANTDAYDTTVLFEDGLHHRFDHIVDMSHPKFDPHFILATMLDVNYGWMLEEPKEKLSEMLIAVVSYYYLLILFYFYLFIF